MNRTGVAAVVLAFCVLPLAHARQSRPAPTRTEIAPGIFLFATPPYGDVGLDGNSIAILSSDGVLVFDTNGTSEASAAVLAHLIVNPITFALSGYPTEWLRVLEKVDRLDADVIVTGHGAPLRDKALLHETMDVFRVLLREGKAAKEKGMTADQARDAVYPRLHDLMVAITGDDPQRNAAFRQQLVDWYLHRVYDELDGPLTDAIAPPPRS